MSRPQQHDWWLSMTPPSLGLAPVPARASPPPRQQQPAVSLSAMWSPVPTASPPLATKSESTSGTSSGGGGGGAADFKYSTGDPSTGKVPLPSTAGAWAPPQVLQMSTTVPAAPEPKPPQTDANARGDVELRFLDWARVLAGHLARGDIDVVWDREGAAGARAAHGTLTLANFSAAHRSYLTNSALAGTTAALSIIRGVREAAAAATTGNRGHDGKVAATPEWTLLDTVANDWSWNDFAGLVQNEMLRNDHLQTLGRGVKVKRSASTTIIGAASGVAISYTQQTFENNKIQHVRPFVFARLIDARRRQWARGGSEPSR